MGTSYVRRGEIIMPGDKTTISDRYSCFIIKYIGSREKRTTNWKGIIGDLGRASFVVVIDWRLETHRLYTIIIWASLLSILNKYN